MIKVFLLLSLLFFSNSHITKQPGEIRAVWVATNFRLDWPPETNDKQLQKEALENIFNDIKSKNFNTIYFQVRSSGTVLFKSSYEPFPEFLKDENDSMAYDPARLAVNSAHQQGLKIHAWFNVMRCFSGLEDPSLTDPGHVYNMHHGWVVKYNYGEKPSYWLDPGLPEVRSYLIKLISEFVRQYNFDGIQLDFLRYPGKYFNDDFSYFSYGIGTNRDKWRRNNLTKFLTELKDSVKKIKPAILIGATPIGIYKNINGYKGKEGYSDVYQDSRKWLKNNLIDYLVPQVYWGMDNEPEFDKLADDWIKHNYGKDIILGIGAFKPEVRKDIKEIISYSRKIRAAGFAIFKYSDLTYFDLDWINGSTKSSIRFGKD